MNFEILPNPLSCTEESGYGCFGGRNAMWKMEQDQEKNLLAETQVSDVQSHELSYWIDTFLKS